MSIYNINGAKRIYGKKQNQNKVNWHSQNKNLSNYVVFDTAYLRISNSILYRYRYTATQSRDGGIE